MELPECSHQLVDVSKSAITTCGAQYVMMALVSPRQWLCADSWATALLVSRVSYRSYSCNDFNLGGGEEEEVVSYRCYWVEVVSRLHGGEARMKLYCLLLPSLSLYTCNDTFIPYVGAGVVSRAPNGAGAGSIWLDGLNCVGSEARLFECPANNIGTNDCSHFEDLSAICTTSKCNTRYVCRKILAAKIRNYCINICVQ